MVLLVVKENLNLDKLEPSSEWTIVAFKRLYLVKSNSLNDEVFFGNGTPVAAEDRKGEGRPGIV